jgi:hypothetical protein
VVKYSRGSARLAPQLSECRSSSTGRIAESSSRFIETTCAAGSLTALIRHSDEYGWLPLVSPKSRGTLPLESKQESGVSSASGSGRWSGPPTPATRPFRCDVLKQLRASSQPRSADSSRREKVLLVAVAIKLFRLM